ALCDRLLDVRPARRVQNADAVVQAIDEARLPRSLWSGRQRAAALVVLAVLSVLGALGIQMPLGRWGEPAAVAVVAPRPALAIIPGPQPESEMDRALQLGFERALTAQLLSAGVDVLDSIRVERTLRELGIARAQSQRMRPRLLEGLAVREVLEIAIASAAGETSVELSMRDGRSGEVLWQQQLVANVGEVIDALLSRVWGVLAQRLDAPLSAADFASAESLRRLARISPLQGAAAIEDHPLGAESSADEWWWALETLERDGRMTEAKNAAREVLQISVEKNLPGWQRVLALAEYLTGAPEDALQRIDLAPVAASNQPLRQLRARVLIAMGRYEDAADELRVLVERDPRNVDAWYLLGKSQLLMGDSQVAVDDALTRALVSAHRVADKRMQADGTHALGIGYRQLGQIDAAGDQFERAANMRKALGDLLGHAASLRNLAAVRSIQGRFAEADATLAAARVIIEPIGDPAAMADLVNDIGLVAEERGDFATALTAYREALGFRQVTGDPGWIAESLLNVGFAYYHVGEFDNAQVFLQQAEQAYSTIDDRAGAIRAQQGLGLSAMARGNFAESRRIVSASLQAAEGLQMREEQSTALAALAELDRLEGDYAAALAKVNAAAAFFAEQGDLRGTVEMHLQLAAIQLDLGEWQAAAETIATLTSEPIANVEQRALLNVRQARLANETRRPEDASRFALEGLELASTAGAAAAEIGNRIEHTRALLALGKTNDANRQIVAAESGLHRFASVPLRLDLLLLRLQLGDEKGLAYRDARSLISKLPAYGQEWRIAALASKQLPAAERAEATQRATRAMEQIAVKLSEPARTAFRAWAASELNPGSQLP
ncbi:MAG: tetratricopeptide repeat protein, partial [Pseudomarimonas sp.]